LGQVYVAQDTELHRRVALKVIQRKHAGNSVSRERFVVEAEITGNLEHPGIVPVYSLGTHPDGRPFYAMRFVKGENLTAAIRRFHAGAAPDFTGLEFRWLLRRFLDVCNTIAYAHSRGILHRDLKPSNIRLGPYGETLVMDWGVAKPVGRGGAVGPSPTDESAIEPHSGSALATGVGQAVGTPAYMSPEQAAGQLDAIGPASDVYSLGATLYVLLTDRPPFRGTADEVLRAVQQGRFAIPREIKLGVPKALDAICRRAMAMQPSERYSSPLAFADEIERWLADEPVSAWREPWPVRARRWVRRHQLLVAGWAAAVAVAMMALVLAVPVLSIAWRNEAEARRDEQQQRIVALQEAGEALEQRARAVRNLEEANQQRALAQAHESKSRAERDRAENALKFLVEVFRRPDPTTDGRSLKVVDLLDRAVHDLEESLANQPLMKATLLSAIGETFSGLGMPQESLAVSQRALTIRRQGLGEDHPETLDSMNNVAMAYQDAGRLDQAIPLLEVTLAKRKALLGDHHVDTLESMNDLAVAYWEAGQPTQAIPLYQATLASARANRGEDHLDTLTIMDNLAVAYADDGRTDRAIPLHETTLAKLEAKLGGDHVTTLVTKNNLARAYEAGGRLDEALRLLETTSARFRAKLGEDHPTTLTAMNSLARVYQEVGQLAKAASLLQTVLAHRLVKLGQDHPETLLTTFALAKVYFATQQPDQAVPLARLFLDRTPRIAGRLSTKVRAAIPQAAQLLVDHYTRTGQNDRAAEFRRVLSRNPPFQAGTSAPRTGPVDLPAVHP
jgi:tetratricopeptide (TPR) repeat protein